jgi:AraC-like DNA-binding protein
MAGSADPRAVQSILRALALVEERLGEPIGVEDMARSAAYSLFHFSRVFTAGTGHAPYDYLMRRRVSAAAEEVVGGARSLTQIALDYGFEAPDGFARAFRRCFGESPSEARRKGGYPRTIARLPIERGLVEYLLEAGPLVPERHDVEERILTGYCAEASTAWCSALEPRCRRIGVSRSFAVRETSPEHPGLLFVGIEAGNERPPRFPLSRTILRGGPWVRFALQGGESALQCVRDFVFRTWLPSQGGSAVPGFEAVECGVGGPEALWVPVEPFQTGSWGRELRAARR